MKKIFFMSLILSLIVGEVLVQDFAYGLEEIIVTGGRSDGASIIISVKEGFHL